MDNQHIFQADLLNSSSEPLLISVSHDLNKKAKKSARWITCSICNKTITKKSMVRHFFAFHEGN
jgi:hypothetical protein